MLAAGQGVTGEFRARVQGLAIGAAVTNTVTVSSPDLPAAVTAAVALDVVPPRANETWATPEQGGILRSTDDRVLLRVPPGAVRGRTRLAYAPQATVPAPLKSLRFAFILKAEDEVGQPVRQPLNENSSAGGITLRLQGRAYTLRKTEPGGNGTLKKIRCC